jgi:hypothetical protein
MLLLRLAQRCANVGGHNAVVVIRKRSCGPAYFAVGIFSAMLMEYEVHFYSFGAIEEDWKVKDLSETFMVASLGSILGSLLTVALLALGVLVLQPQHIFPEQLSSALLAGACLMARRC